MQPDNAPSMQELPPPQVTGENIQDSESRQPAIEQERAAGELPSVGSPSFGQAPVQPITNTPNDPSGAADSPLANASTPSIALAADDSDLIEKEWVERAKAIVNQTKDNPHQQTKAMNKFKADYVKKRYNKELKVNES